MRIRALLSFLALASALSCAEGHEDSLRPALERIPGDAFAVVGDRSLPLDLLREFAPTERKARARAVVRDELLRLEAEHLGSERARVVRRGELARSLIESTEREVRMGRRLTEDELRQEYEARWLEYDRPRSVRTVQALFPVAPPVNDDMQFENATRFLAAVRGTHNLRQFGDRARPIMDELGSSVRVYEMPPLTPDGRIVPLLPKDAQVAEISPHLSAEVAKLSNAGDISEVVGTEEGYHVFFVTEVVPEKRKPFEDVRDELARAVYARRVQDKLDVISKSSDVPVERRRTDISKLLTLVQQAQ